MSVQAREAVAAALFTLVSGAAGAAYSSRVLVDPRRLEPAQMPALFQTQIVEPNARGALGLPSKRSMHFSVWLVVSYAQADSVVPSTQLNAMIDAIEAALEPTNKVTNIQTLGGITASARIDGNIEYAENFTGDGTSIAVIPIVVILP